MSETDIFICKGFDPFDGLEADIEVVCPGMLEVLSIGKGDLKLTWGSDPDDEAKARATIEEMLRKGYAIFVETDVGPARVQRFSAERMTYVITEVADGHELPTGPVVPALEAGPQSVAEATGVGPPEPATPQPKKRGGRPRKTKETEVPLAGSKATAVGRTAGG